MGERRKRKAGHLGLILPIDIEAINRVEILNGPAAQLYGANAFSGAINFISIPAEINSAKITATYGEYGFFSASATVNLSEKHFRNLLFFSNSKSDGYASNTDFQKTSIYYQGQVLTKEGVFDVQFGYSDRAFGANGFYTPKFPDQFEENQMTFGSLSFKSGSKIKSQSKIYWRRLRDRFELFREDNKWYRIQNGITISNDTSRTAYDTITWYSQHNHHINDVFGMDVNLETRTKIGVTSLGWHLRSENIISNNIGYDRSILIPVRGYDSTYYTKSDSRAVFDLYAEQTIDLKPFFIAAIASINWNSFSPDEIHFLPGIDLRFDITRQFSAIASYNYTIGLPTFTDLHYRDPNNQGNLDLKAYTQNSVEGGLRWVYDANMITSNCFFNFGKGIIDWVWLSSDSIFRPINIDNFSARGIEISSLHNFTKQFGADFPIQDLRNKLYIHGCKEGYTGKCIKILQCKADAFCHASNTDRSRINSCGELLIS